MLILNIFVASVQMNQELNDKYLKHENIEPV